MIFCAAAVFHPKACWHTLLAVCHVCRVGNECMHQSGNVVQGATCQTALDTRAALVLLLIARCNMEQTALQQAGGEALFATLLKDADARVRYHASMFVQQRLVAAKADQYRRALRQLTQQAQQINDEKLLRNPYLQISAMLDMRLIDLSV